MNKDSAVHDSSQSPQESPQDPQMKESRGCLLFPVSDLACVLVDPGVAVVDDVVAVSCTELAGTHSPAKGESG